MCSQKPRGEPVKAPGVLLNLLPARVMGCTDRQVLLAIREHRGLAAAGGSDQKILETLARLRIGGGVARDAVLTRLAALTELVHRDPGAAAVLPQPVAGAKDPQNCIAALNGALNGGHGKRISGLSAPTDQAPGPHRVSTDETKWIPWDKSQGDDTTAVFRASPRTHSTGENAPRDP